MSVQAYALVVAAVFAAMVLLFLVGLAIRPTLRCGRCRHRSYRHVAGACLDCACGQFDALSVVRGPDGGRWA